MENCFQCIKKIDMTPPISPLNFQCAAILNVYDVMWLPLIVKNRRSFIGTIRQLYDVITIQNGGA